MQILNKHTKSKNHFFSEQLKQSYNYEAESIIQKKNFLDIDNRFNKKPVPEQNNRSTTSKIEFYEQQIRQMDQINQNFVERLATSEIQLKQYHFDAIKLNQQINNLQRVNLELNDKYEALFTESKQNQKYISQLQGRIKNIEDIIAKLYKTSNENNEYKDLEFIFNTDSCVEKQLQTICYVMLQCCRQNSFLRKTLSQQQSMITKLDKKTNAANVKTNLQLQATSKLLNQFEPIISTITFDENNYNNQYQLSPFKTPSRNTTFDKKQQSRMKYSSRQPSEVGNWEKSKIKSQLREIDCQIDRLQAKIMEEMRY